MIWFAVLEPQWSFRAKDASDLGALIIVSFSEAALLGVIALYQREVRRAWMLRDETDRQRELLVNELNHRVKNTLSVVQSLATQSLKELDGAPIRAFTSRLMALARGHDLLARNNWDNADISSVVNAALAPYQPGNRIEVVGPALPLAPSVALNLALALNELATNASKYGALSVEAGKATLSWAAEGNQVCLQWVESGGPPVAPPQREGFGLRMLKQAFSADPGSEVDLDFAPTGLICRLRIAMPAEAAVSMVQPARADKRTLSGSVGPPNYGRARPKVGSMRGGFA